MVRLCLVSLAHFAFEIRFFLLLFSYSCPNFPLLLSPTSPNTHAHSQSPPCGLCPWAPYTCSLTQPFPFFFHHLPLPSSLVTVSLFFISMFLVLFCSFVCFIDQVTFLGEIIWYLPFTASLISLSIMLSSSIHAVTKGRSSCFLSIV